MAVMQLPKMWELLARMLLALPIEVAQEILPVMRELLPIKTLRITVLAVAPRRLPKSTEEVIFPPLNVLAVPKIVVSFTRVLDKRKPLPKIVELCALLVEPPKFIPRPIIGVSSIWASFNLILCPITGEEFAVVPHNESPCPITGE